MLKFLISGLLLFVAFSCAKSPATQDAASDGATPNLGLHDIWYASDINGSPVERSGSVPRLELYVKEMRVTGTDGCNEIMGSISKLTATELTFGPMAGTKMMCRDMQVADQFNKALAKVAGYRLEGLSLSLLGAGNEVLLSFVKGD